MRAIDVIFRFLVAAETDDLPPVSRLVLLAVAAGLHDPQDIAVAVHRRVGDCMNLLRSLVERGELRWIGQGFELADTGKARVRRLLAIACGRERA